MRRRVKPCRPIARSETVLRMMPPDSPAPDLPGRIGIKFRERVLVAVEPKSPAAAAGLRVDDVILRADGIELSGDDAADTRLIAGPVGSELSLVVQRGDEEFTVTLRRHPASAFGAAPADSPAAAASKRYSDAYVVARLTCGIGGVVKVVAVLVAFLSVAVALIAGAATDANPLLTLGAILISIIAGVPTYVLGVLLVALGQHLKAGLDVAVHTSPFLDNDEKAAVMSLK